MRSRSVPLPLPVPLPVPVAFPFPFPVLALVPVLVLILLATTGVAFAVAPVSRVNYQGVLRDANDVPRTGTFDMDFAFLTAPSGGSLIMTDKHEAAYGNAVSVSNGLFSVQLGGGHTVNGSGPGNYTSLDAVFHDYAVVYLQVTVGGETLSPPFQIVAAAYALNATSAANADNATHSGAADNATHANAADNATHAAAADNATYATSAGSAQNLGGAPPSNYLDVTTTGQMKQGEIDIYTSGPYAIQTFATSAGGHFRCSAGSGDSYLGLTDVGVYGTGATAGGQFANPSNTSAYIASATAGGEFHSPTGTTAYAAYTDVAVYGRGIDGSGGVLGGKSGAVEGRTISTSLPAGYFIQNLAFPYNPTAAAHVASGSTGVEGRGAAYGGLFSSMDGAAYWAQVSSSGYKIKGTGAVSFVQNHPDARDKVIVYAAPEGSEVAVYARGSARLAGGAATVALDPTFAMVANPDVGLTAHLTPRGRSCALYTTALGTASLSVAADGAGCADVAFDYLVYGLRLGFEKHPTVQPKEREALLPPPGVHEAILAAHPDLRPYTALARFTAARAALGETAPLDLSRGAALARKIDGDREAVIAAGLAALPGDNPPALPESSRSAFVPPAASAPAVAFVPPAGAAPSPSLSTASVATASASPATVARTVVTVLEDVDGGDLLALDPLHPGAFVKSRSASDPLAVAIASGSSSASAAAVGLEAPVFDTIYAALKVDASYAPVHAGDLLVASPTPGHAMRAPAGAPQAAIVGKALGTLEAGQGTLRVLVTAR